MKEKNSKKILSLLCAGCIAINSVPMLSYADDMPSEALTSEHTMQQSPDKAGFENMTPVSSQIGTVNLNVKYNDKIMDMGDLHNGSSQDYINFLADISIDRSLNSIKLEPEVGDDAAQYEIKLIDGKKFQWIELNSNDQSGSSTDNWKDIKNTSDNFMPSVYGKYGIKVTLVPKAGQQFASSVNVEGSTEKIFKINADEVQIIYQIRKSVRKNVGEINITIDEPIEGNTFDATKGAKKSDPNAPYKITKVSWEEKNKLSNSSSLNKFEGGKNYEATIEVTLNEFYDRNEEEISKNKASINGQEVNAKSAEVYFPDVKSGNLHLESLKQATITFVREFKVHEFKPITKFEVDSAEINLDDLFSHEVLSVTIEPDNATNKEIEWKSENENIATVKKIGDNTAMVSPVATGKATITATIKNAKKENGQFQDETRKITVHVNLPFDVTFKPQGGTIKGLGSNADQKISLRKDEKIDPQEFPTVERDGYRFVGWFTEPNGGIPVDKDMTYHEATTVYAQWVKQIKIKFDANGGLIGGEKTIDSIIDEGAKLSTLPTPSRSGYHFIGWYTKKNGGERVTTDKPLTADTELFAQWAIVRDSSEDNISDSGSGSTSKVEKNNKDKMDKKPQEPKKEQPSEKPKADNTAAKTALEKIEKFQDVKKEDWFYAPVLKVLESGIMNSISEKEFAPNTASTRAMIVTMLHNLEGKPATKNAFSFKDVKNDQYYADPVSWALEQKLVNGVAQGLFAPDTEISREQLATILYHYYLLKNKDNAPSKKMELKEFVDSTQVSDYAKEAMMWAVSNQLILGTDKNELNPKSQATRAQTAAIFARLLDLLKK